MKSIRIVLCLAAVVVIGVPSWAQQEVLEGEAQEQIVEQTNVQSAAPNAALVAVNKEPPAPSPTTSVASAEGSDVLSFIEWKSSRVHEAQRKLEQLNQQGNQQQLTFNVDVALQLNIQDYFSMYLKNLDKSSFRAAAKKLSDEEVSELLTAYKNHLEKGSGDGVKFSKSPKIQEKSQNQ